MTLDTCRYVPRASSPSDPYAGQPCGNPASTWLILDGQHVTARCSGCRRLGLAGRKVVKTTRAEAEKLLDNPFALRIWLDSKGKLDPELLNIALDKAAEALVTMLYLYPNYRVDNRGPMGCIMEALGAIAPHIAEEVLDKGANVTYRERWGEEMEDRDD